MLILELFGISSPRSVVGIERLRHLLNQSNASQKLVTEWLNQIFSSLSFPKGLNIFAVCNKRPLRFSTR